MLVSLKDRNIANIFNRLLVIQVISVLISLTGTLVDGAVISFFLGPISMSAFGLTHPLVIVIVSISFILTTGTNAVIGGFLGRGETDKVNKTMNMVIFTGFGIGLLFTFLFFTFSRELSFLLGARGDCLEASSNYIKGFAFSAIGVMMTPVLVSLMQIDRDGRRAMAASVVFLCSCITTDFINVLVLKLGMLGMGLTTSVSYFISVSVLLLHFLKKNTFLKINIREYSVRGLGKIFTIGFPAATFHLSNFLKIASMNHILIVVAGTAGIFAFTVQNTINSILIGFINGTGITTLLVSSVIAGEQNRRSLHHTLKYIFKVGIGIALVLSMLILIFARSGIARFFCTNGSAVYTECVVDMLKIYALSIPFTMINVIFINFYQSLKKIKLANLCCILDNALFLVASAFILAHTVGLPGIWYSHLIAELLMLLTLCFIVLGFNKKFPVSVHDLMMVPDEFGVDVDHRMNITVINESELPIMAEKIKDFCKKHNIEDKKALAVSLCMEELSVVAFRENTSKKKYVDIYLAYKNGELNLRIRDNGIPLDLGTLNRLKNPSDSEKDLGFRIVQKMVRKVNYSCVLGLNVFTINI